jgi:hypothetical protein
MLRLCRCACSITSSCILIGGMESMSKMAAKPTEQSIITLLALVTPHIFPPFFWLVFVFHCYTSGQIRTQECFWSLKNSCIIASQHNFFFSFRSQSFFLSSVGINFIATFLCILCTGHFLHFQRGHNVIFIFLKVKAYLIYRLPTVRIRRSTGEISSYSGKKSSLCLHIVE